MIAIINSGNNIASIQNAFKRLNVDSVLTHDINIIKNASHVIIPGVGHAAKAMQQLRELNLIETIRTLTQPVLGICLGMQLLFDDSEEGNTDCLGVIPGSVKQFDIDRVIPHMGWNQCERDYYYFAHSYYVPINPYTIATTAYGIQFSAICQYRNFVGMQFHPEKSGLAGERLLMKFIRGER